MKSITEIINEALDDVESIENEILRQLKKKNNLRSFVEAMNKMLKHSSKDDNGAMWYAAIKDLFDGQKEDGKKYTAHYESILVSDLFPTQSEIDIVNSAKWVLPKFINNGTVDSIFNDDNYGKAFGCPVLVFNDGCNWIIDGHHRWSQVGLLNPEGSLHCLVISGPCDVKEFLKLTQGAIAAVIADKDNVNHGEGGTLPVGKAAPQNNIFGNALKGDKLKDKMIEMMNDGGTEETLPMQVSNYIKNIKTDEDVAEHVCNCRDLFIKNGQQPKSWAAPRPVMPQTDTASPRGFKAPGAEDEGGAISALIKGYFPSLK